MSQPPLNYVSLLLLLISGYRQYNKTIHGYLEITLLASVRLFCPLNFLRSRTPDFSLFFSDINSFHLINLLALVNELVVRGNTWKFFQVSFETNRLPAPCEPKWMQQFILQDRWKNREAIPINLGEIIDANDRGAHYVTMYGNGCWATGINLLLPADRGQSVRSRG